MEQKKKSKKKIVIIILLLTLIPFLIFAGLVGRKMIILSSLDKKVSKYKTYPNMYNEMVSDANSDTIKLQTAKVYIKDGIIKHILEIEKYDGTKNIITQVTSQDERKVFIDNAGVKNVGIYREQREESMVILISNYVKSDTFGEELSNSITAKITTQEIDGKVCYAISSIKNSNFLYAEGTEEMVVYIEKDTGLPIKRVEVLNKDGERKEFVSNYKYEFDSVTDEDMKEPDMQEYLNNNDNAENKA